MQIAPSQMHREPDPVSASGRTTQAICHARSRKRYWHMAKTIASGVGLTGAWLEEQGLISIKMLWVELAPLRRTA